MRHLSLLLPALAVTATLACGEAEQPKSEHVDKVEAPAKEAAKVEAPVTNEATKGVPATTEAKPTDPALLDPSTFTETAPDTYVVTLHTTEGDVVLDVTRAWSPNGADRFYNLVKGGYFTDVAFFRVIDGFMAQIGLHGDPAVNTAWRQARIEDDPAGQSNGRGFVSFATAGPNTRTTQFFINFSDNARLDGMGFTPFAKVRDMSIVDKLHKGYGEGAPMGKGPSQGRIQAEGNAYLKAEFPELDYVTSAEITE